MSDNKDNSIIIEVKHLKASFEDRQVLTDVSFTIYKNQVTVLLGSSGSGKTTILKHLIGLYPIQEGELRVLGKNMGQLEEEQQENLYHKIGVFFQNGALLNSMTVAENVALPIEQHSDLSGELLDQLVKLKLRLVNLTQAYHLYPSQLSGGMLKRAALARAIAMDPPLLFCDEPGAGLDPISLADLDRLIKNLKEQLGITIVLVTHEVSSILRLADRIIFLDKGKVLFEGTLSEALSSEIALIDNFFHKGEIKFEN
ncbi:MAG: ABC transporter ATP-binding protein [Candidatus Cyclobacteriaceae bacterium M3_2C_046]